jgi:RNA polymerase sigma-70 factor (ECF subfamily)
VRIVATENSKLAGPPGEILANVKPAEVFLTETALLRKVIAGLGLRGADADDILQTVSVKCLHHAGGFTDRRRCRRWLIRVTTNECITEHRRAARFRRHSANTVERRCRPTAKGPIDSAVSSEQIGAVQEALHEMDEKLLKPLVLRYFCDLKSAEIGEILDLPATTVRSLLLKGRLALAKALLNRGIER